MKKIVKLDDHLDEAKGDDGKDERYSGEGAFDDEEVGQESEQERESKSKYVIFDGDLMVFHYVISPMR
jgi:hypothetical protein